MIRILFFLFFCLSCFGGIQIAPRDTLGSLSCATNEIPKWSGSVWACATDSSGGAGGTPGGANTQVQFNNSGSFGGSADFVFDDSGLSPVVIIGADNNDTSLLTYGTVQGISGFLTADTNSPYRFTDTDPEWYIGKDITGGVLSPKLTGVGDGSVVSLAIGPATAGNGLAIGVPGANASIEVSAVNGDTWINGVKITAIGDAPDYVSQILFPTGSVSQIELSTIAGQDNAFLGSGNGGPTSRISAPYFSMVLATNPGGDTLGTGIIGVNALPSLIEWQADGSLYFNGMKWPSADGTADQFIKTDGANNLSFSNVMVGVGSPVASSTPGSVLFVDSSGNLAEASGLTYDGSDIFQASNINTTGFAFTGGGEMDVVGNLYAVQLAVSTSGSSGAVEYTFPLVKATGPNQVITDVLGDGTLSWEDQVLVAPGSTGDMFYNNSGVITAMGYVTWDDASPNMIFANSWASFPGNSKIEYDASTVSSVAVFNPGNINAGGVPLEPFTCSDGEAVGFAGGAVACVATGGGNPFDQDLNTSDAVSFGSVKTYLNDDSNNNSIYPNARQMFGTDGTTVLFDWNNGISFFAGTPAAQQANIPDPTGGLVVDDEARAAIAAINALLQAYNLEAAP